MLPTGGNGAARQARRGRIRDEDQGPEDSRAVVVDLTPAGRERLARARAAYGTAMASRLADFDVERLARMETDLNELLEALKKAAPQHDPSREHR